MKKKVLAMVLSLTAALTLLAGCGGGQTTAGTPAATGTEASAAPAAATAAAQGGAAETPAQPDGAARTERSAANELTIGIANDFDSLDPHHMTAAGTKEVLFNVFEGLVKPTSTGEIVPAVASEVTVSEDGLTYTFTLRQGVKFHNGEPVELGDVLYSIERRRSGEDAAAYLSALDIIDTAEAADGAVVVTLREPSLDFLAFMMNVYIIPADYDAQETAPVGTGPYRFVSRSIQDNLVLERFADYWGEPGRLDRVTFKILENAEGLVLGLQSGALDLVSHMTTDQTGQLSAQEFQIEEGSMNLVQALYLNNAEAPFDDVRVRQALCCAVDKQAVIDLAFDGYGIPLGTSMFPSFGKYYDTALTDYYTYDPARARELLAEAGYPDGFEMSITVPSNYTPHVNTAQVLVELLREVGITATVQPVEWGVWLEDVYGARQFQSTVTGLTSDNMTARKLLERFGSSVSNNFTNYNNADYDALLAQALSATDGAAQTELYRAMERNLTENAANVYLQDMADLVAVRAGLAGLTFYPLYVLDISTLYWA